MNIPKGCPHDHRHRPHRHRPTDTARTPASGLRKHEDFTASAEDVLAALRTTEAISSWWAPPRARPTWGHPRDGLPLRQHAARAVRGAGRGGPGRLVRARGPPLTPEWVGTTIVFAVEDTGGGSDAPLPSPRPDAAVRLLRHVRRGLDEHAGPPGARSSRPVRSRTPGTASSPPRASAPRPRRCSPRCAHRRPSRPGGAPPTGSADVGGTLVVSFFGGEQRIVMAVEPAPEGRVDLGRA